VLQGITFQAFSPNNRSGNTLTVTPSGLEVDNKTIEMDVSGIITRIEMADINADGSPELLRLWLRRHLANPSRMERQQKEVAQPDHPA
jgi:hypothetical protein